MRRGTLTVVVLAIIAITVIMAPVSADTAVGIGANKTRIVPQSWIASRMEVINQNLIGMWSSTTGQMVQVYDLLGVVAYGDFVNYRNVKDVSLIATRGKEKFEWRATKLDKKVGIYQVCLPRLAAGIYDLRWKMVSRDVTDKTDVCLIIPLFEINEMEKRSTEASCHLVVQRAPAGAEDFTDEQAFLFTRGLIPVWATPDPSLLAQKVAVQQMESQMTQVQPVQQPVSQPVVAAPVVRQPAPKPEPKVEDTLVDEAKMVTPAPTTPICLKFGRWDCPIKRPLLVGKTYRFIEPSGSESGRFKVVSVQPELITTVVIKSGSPTAAAKIWEVK